MLLTVAPSSLASSFLAARASVARHKADNQVLNHIVQNAAEPEMGTTWTGSDSWKNGKAKKVQPFAAVLRDLWLRRGSWQVCCQHHAVAIAGAPGPKPTSQLLSFSMATSLPGGLGQGFLSQIHMVPAARKLPLQHIQSMATGVPELKWKLDCNATAKLICARL